MTPPATKTAEGRTVSRTYRVEFTAKQLDEYEKALESTISTLDTLAPENDPAAKLDKLAYVLEKLLEKLQIQSRLVPTSTPSRNP